MDLPRGSGRLGERLALAAVLITLAGVLYLVGTVGATAVSCPAGGAGTKGSISFWPPGKECASAAGGETTVQPLFSGIEWGIVGLGLIAVGLLLFAVLAEIRRLRRPPARLSRPWTSRSPMSRATSSPRSVTSAAGRPARPSSASG